MTWVSSILEIAAFFVGFVVVLGALGFVCLRQYYLARRKGYSPMAAGAVVGCALVGVIIFAVLASVLIDDRGWSNAEKNAFVFLVLAVPPPLLVAALVAALPPRNAKHAGARSSRFLESKTARWLERGLYWSGGAIVAIGVVGLWWFSNAGVAGKMINLGVSLLAIPALFTYYRKRAAAPTLEAALAADPRPPVLYLRAFFQESDAFTWGPKEEMARYTAAPITAQTWYTISVTFEQYLGSAISNEIGPLVALGNPEDVLPPEGAAREYAEDRDWQQEFLKLAETATAIVMEVSRSDNLRWEVAALRSHGWQRKLFVITPPVPKSTRAAYRWLYAVLRAAKGVSAPRWSEFAPELTNAGFQIDTIDPGPGAVVTFDLAGRAEVVARAAADPEDFAGAIRTRLKSLVFTDGATADLGNTVRHQDEVASPEPALRADVSQAARQ
jgi:hypothetical protein